MDGFKSLAGVKRGDYTVSDPQKAAAASMSALAGIGAAKEVPFDRLPLHIQDWSRRCREAVKHG